MVYPQDHTSLFISALSNFVYPLSSPSRSALSLPAECLATVLRASRESTWPLRHSPLLILTYHGARDWPQSLSGCWSSAASLPSHTSSCHPPSVVPSLSWHAPPSRVATTK